MADGTQAYNLPAQTFPLGMGPQGVGPYGDPSQIPRVAPIPQAQPPGGSMVPTGPGGPQVAYQLPAQPQPYGPLTAPAGLPMVNNPAIPQATPWIPTPPSQGGGAAPSIPQPIQQQTPPQQEPLLQDAWKTYAAGIKDHAPNRQDYDKFAQWYQTRYVDPHLASIKALKPGQLKAYQSEFQQRASDFGDQLFQGEKPNTPGLGTAIAKGAEGGTQAMLANASKLLGGVASLGGTHPNAISDYLLSQADASKQAGLNPAGQNREQFLQMMLGSNYGNPQYAQLQNKLAQTFDSAYGQTSLAGASAQNEQQAYGANKWGAMGGNAVPALASFLLPGGALTGIGANVASDITGASTALADKGATPQQQLAQLAIDTPISTLTNLLPTKFGGNILMRALKGGATGAAANVVRQAADNQVNPTLNNKFDPDELKSSAIMQAVIAALHPYAESAGNALAQRAGNALKKPGAPAPTATPPPAANAPAAAPAGAPTAAPGVAASPADHFNAAVNVNADANGVSAQSHANSMSEFNKDLTAGGKTRVVQTAVKNSTDPQSVVENATALARHFIDDDTWNTFSTEQRQFAIEEASAFLAKKAGVDPTKVADQIKQYAKPPATSPTATPAAAPNIPAGAEVQGTMVDGSTVVRTQDGQIQIIPPASASASPAAAPAPASGVKETPLPSDISGQQVPGTQPQAAVPNSPEELHQASGGAVTGQHPEVEAQHLYNVATGVAQDAAVSSSPLGKAITRAVQSGLVKSPADVQTVIEKLANKGKTATPAAQTPAATPAAAPAPKRNPLQKTNAQQAEEHANVASTVSEALSDKSTPQAAKDKLKARVQQNAAQKYNEQYMQAALNHGVSSGPAEDAIRADPHFMAIRQAVQDGRITSPEQLGSFLKNERDITEQANKQVAEPVNKTPLKKATTGTDNLSSLGNAANGISESYYDGLWDTLTGGPKSSRAFAKEPYYAAAKQAVADGRITSRDQLKSVLSATDGSSASIRKALSKPLKKEGTPSPKSEAPVANTGAATTDLEAQLRDRFGDTLPQHAQDQLHDAVANARMGDGRDLGDLIQGWKDSGDISNEDAKWLRQQAKIEAAPKPNHPSRHEDTAMEELREARANEDDDNEDYLNDEYHQNNASGESSASLEAQNRLRDERNAGQTRAIIRRDGSVEPLRGVDAVDTHARSGEVVVQRGVGKEPWTVLSHGDDLTRDVAAGKINRARADLDALHNTMAPQREVDVPGFGKINVDATHDVQLLAGSPNKGNRVYVDKDWNPHSELEMQDGSTSMVDRTPFIVVHELEERRLEQQGESYTDAHHAATKKELDAVRKAGINTKSYQDSFHNEIEAAAKKVNGNPPNDLVEKPYEHPHSVRAREALANVQDHEDFGPHGEYTLHMDDLDALADERTRNDVGTERELDKVAPLQTKRRVGQILNGVREGADIHETGRELQKLKEDIDNARMQAKLKESLRQPKRGVEYVRQRLQEMVANHEPGDDHYEAGKFGQWLLDQNPNLANYLGVRIRDMGERGASGNFDPAERLFGINSRATNPGTAVHEIMHSAEQLMPDDMQQRIRGEYIGRLQNKLKQAVKSGNKTAQRYLELAVQNFVHPSVEVQTEMRTLFRANRSTLPYDEYYKYSNPSEYWAVESTDMLNNRYTNNGWADRIKQWLSGYFEHVKSLLGLDSNHQVSKALDRILKSPGEDYNGRMLRTPRGTAENPSPVLDENAQGADDEDRVFATGPNKPSKAAQAASDRAAASADTRGSIGKANFLVEQLAKAGVGVDVANQGLRRAGVEINADNNVDEALYRSRGLHSEYNAQDAYDTFRPFNDYVNKNFQRFGSNMKEALSNLNMFFQNTHFMERVRTMALIEAPMNSAAAELKRAKLLDDVESLKIDKYKANKQLEAMEGDLKYGWEQWGRNHNVPIQAMQDKLADLKTRFGMDQISMADLNKVMDGARQRQLERLQASGQVAKDDPWTGFYNWKWYVPLKSTPLGDENSSIFDLIPSKSMSASQLNDSIKAMHGRSDFAELPMFRLYADTARAGRMHANSEVSNALYNLVTDKKAAKVLGAQVEAWEGTPHDGFTNKTTGQFQQQLRPVSNRQQIQMVVHDGRDHYMVTLPGDSQLGRGLVATQNIRPPDMIGKQISKVTNVLSRMYTTLNPVWQTFTAFARDMTYVPMVGATTEYNSPIDALPFFAKYTGNALKSIAALRQLAPALRGDLSALHDMATKDPDSWAAWTQRYMRLGGNNEFVGGMNVDAIHKVLGQAGFDRLPRSADDVIDATKLGYDTLLKYTNRYADFVTQIPRVALFRTFVEGGMDERSAAAKARAVLDYGQSGMQGRRINAYKAFFRVSATGVDAMRRAFVKPTGGYDFAKLAKWGAFYSMLGAAGYMTTNALLGQDEDGKDIISKMLPETIATKVLFPLGDQVGGWQMGLGLPQIMMAPGALMAAVQAGHVSMSDAMKAYTQVLQRNTGLDSEVSREGTPAGFLGGLIKAFIPTAAEPLVDIHDNMNQYGNSIYNEPRKGHYAADSGRASTPQTFKDFAGWLNRTTNGAIDIAPEEIQYLTKQYGGQYATTLITQMQNDSLEKHTGLPIPGLVHDQDFYQQRELYDTLGELDTANKRYNAVMDHAKENGATDQQARAQAEQMLLANPELRQQRQLYSQLASAASARAAAMKQLRDNKFLSPTGRELKMKQIDSTLRQTLDTVTNRMQ